MGNWAWGIGDWELGMGNWAWLVVSCYLLVGNITRNQDKAVPIGVNLSLKALRNLVFTPV
ncbi:MAG: hypothetical protein ACBR12_00160 [Microcoleus sp.]|uniref:hypothetical protein n=1 Tax=unclassified Microcoleus TaxID=2642155 RepID=UPI00312B82A1